MSDLLEASEHGLGWVAEPPPTIAQRARSKLRTARTLLLCAPARPPEAMLALPEWVLSQGSSESCTGHFAVEAIYGLTGKKCSPYLPWWFARAIQDGPENVRNTGVNASSFTKALARHGTCTYGNWNPRTPGFDRNAQPPALARIEAQRQNLRLSGIYAVGQSALDAVLDALARGNPVGIVVDVDAGLLRPQAGGIVGPRSGASRGLHILTGWGYRTRPDGSVQIRVVNSWGEDWGDHGGAWLDAHRIRNAPYLCVAEEVS